MTTNNNNNNNNITSPKELRHVESMATFPSGAGNIPQLNAVILGDALASEEFDLIFPSHEFSSQALVPSPQKVLSFYIFITSLIDLCDDFDDGCF